MGRGAHALFFFQGAMVTIKKVSNLVRHYQPVMGLDSWDIFVGVHTFDDMGEAWGRSDVLIPYMRATISIADCVPKRMLRYTVVHEMAHIITAHSSSVAHGIVATLPEDRRKREDELVSNGDETVTEFITRVILRLEGRR